MINKLQKQILIMALYAGELMMKSGAEVYRVEDTIERICKACRIDYVECFATTTGIFLSLDKGSDDSDMYTFIKRIKSSTIDLKHISDINRFSRVFTSTDLSIGDGFEQLKEIAADPIYRLPIRLLGAVLIGATMSLFYGADMLVMCFAGISGGLGYLMSRVVAIANFPEFIRIFVSCAVSTAAALLLLSIGNEINTNAAILGAVTIFMPGVAITNSARDILSGDMLAGVSRALDAIVTAVSIAGATVAIIAVWKFAGGSTGDAVASYHPAFFLLFGVILTLGFCLLYHAPIRNMPLICGIGGIGMYTFVLFKTADMGSVAPVFLGCCIVAVLAECASRAGKEATTIFILPGIIPFVPGLAMYESMSFLIEHGIYSAAVKAAETFICAGSIAVALILVASLTRLIFAFIVKIKPVSGTGGPDS